MEPTTDPKILALEQKIDAIYVSVEKMRRYFFWTLVLTVAFFVLPLLALSFVVPTFIGNYTSALESFGQ